MNLISGMSIRNKILGLGVIGVAGFLMVMSYNFWVSVGNAELLTTSKEVHFPVLEQIDANKVRLDKVSELFNQAVASGEIDLLDSAAVLADEFTAAINQVVRLSPELASDFNRIGSEFDDFVIAGDKLSRGLLTDSLPSGAIAPAVQQMQGSLKKVTQSLLRTRDQSYTAFISSLDQVNSSSETGLLVSLVISGITAAVMLFSAFVVSSMIVANMKKITDSLRNMADGDGDLTQAMSSPGDDEMGEMVDWFNRFVAMLRTLIGDVVQSTTELGHASRAMTSVTEQSKQGATEQQRETEETSSSI
ncbi:MAG: methyl-accepting chemotaxis protein, partial [Immundisolibacteraceae bacterium]|nr:methyl-accepting chemotaxis protein [Immundisolibacteraceae bacterium]